MENSIGNGKIVLFLLISLFVICCQKDNSHTSINKIESNLYCFENATLIFRKGNGLFSEVFSNVSIVEKRFSHVGIIFNKKDSIFVIHAEADDYSGIGHVKIDNFESFIKTAYSWAIYGLVLSEIEKKSILNKALFHVKNQTPFDINFDLKDSEKLYCTELVVKVYNESMDCNFFDSTTKFGDNQVYAIDDLYLRANSPLSLIFDSENSNVLNR